MADKSGSKTLARIYAQALYEAALKAGILSEVSSELTRVNETLAQLPKARQLFESPAIAFAEKRKVVEASLASFSQIMRNFLLVLIERNRITLMSSIAREFSAYTNLKSGIASLEVQSARPLESSERDRLVAILEAKLKKKIELKEHVRAELLGGLILVHEDRQWNGSVARKLKEILGRMEEAGAAAAS